MKREHEWRVFFEVLAASRDEAQRELQSLLLARYLEFQILRSDRKGTISML
jgi:hypothetical protein